MIGGKVDVWLYSKGSLEVVDKDIHCLELVLDQTQHY